MQVVVVSKPDEAPKPKVKEEKAAVPPPVVATGPVSLPAEATEIPKVHFLQGCRARADGHRSHPFLGQPVGAAAPPL